MPVLLSPASREAIVEHARREAPRECCGLLIGTAGRIVEVVAARNEAERATEYRIAPEDHFAAVRRARALGLEVLGAYHSHPASPAEPSPRDLADAWPDFLYLIVSLAPSGRPGGTGGRTGGQRGGEPAAGQADLRAWRLEAGRFVEVDLAAPGESG
jgi:proteasome lid subunit RPN8/RPN11